MKRQDKKYILIAGAIIGLCLITRGSVANAAVTLLQGLEGFSANAYWDRKAWSIGYGSQWNWDEDRPVKKGDTVTPATALRWLKLEAQSRLQEIKSLLRVKQNDKQLTSLTSFAYNVGVPAFAGSTMLSLINAGADKNVVAQQFDRWLIPASIAGRRAIEKKLYLS